MNLPTRPLGKTGLTPTVFGLGGEGILRTHGRDREAAEVVRTALDLGVTYFEAARAYAGCEGYLGQSLGSDRKHVALATKTHHRRARGARAHLDESLALLRTDWLDLWYIHDLRSPKDLDEISGPGGALETVDRARQSGEVRWVGISGHEDPEILLRALELYDFDCILMPVNPAEAFTDSFAGAILPVARSKGLGVVAMKTLCRGVVRRLPGFSGCSPYLHYALSQEGVSLVSVGCDDPLHVQQNAEAARSFTPLSSGQQEVLEQQLYPFAPELMYYRPPGTLSPDRAS